MTADDLDKRAELTIWLEAGTGQTRQGREFATLREALCAAVDALHDPEARPWIVTEEGDILSPYWIRENRDMARRHRGGQRVGRAQRSER
ncbi:MULTISPECIES: hypothetical protein [Methylobacterium]|jgi:hypothetical protein|uniref:Uncharacterized protein n=3 Tax=Methylobacterium TaxID=407 RepID=A0A509EKP2_9HYPH|nr:MULTISPECIES: hypothetical protein [Methylobacterium]KOX57343.1 hypothetical protein ADL19_09615 [Streptomyces purpurogeneiscleroticus]AYO86527.1 hypothetical protein EBB05_29660 [Methylobacterium brachiatum]MBP29140.1 hypothetical protein [Methylobacterium sp.]MCB4806571.1 hypothetical protein [Methylobacterium brachiatum]MDQ0547226.1 hypothetical protein [Methylobacterium brachiatum]